MKLTTEQRWGLVLYDAPTSALQVGRDFGISMDLLTDETVLRVHAAAESLAGTGDGEQLLHALTGADAAEVKRWAAVADEEDWPGVPALAEALRTRKSPPGASEALAATTPPPAPPKPAERPETGRKQPVRVREELPGIAGELSRYIRGVHIVQDADYSDAAAIFILAVLVARKVRLENQVPVLYFLLLGDPSRGKSDLLSIIRKILVEVGAGPHVREKFTSERAMGESFDDNRLHPVIAALVDECENYFAGMNRAVAGRGAGGADTMLEAQANFWSLGDEPRVQSASRVRATTHKDIAPLVRPHLCQLFTAHPRKFAGVFGDRQVDDGLATRFLFVNPKSRVLKGIKRLAIRNRLEHGQQTPRDLLDKLKALWNYLGPDCDPHGPQTLEQAVDMGLDAWKVPIDLSAAEDVDDTLWDASDKGDELSGKADKAGRYLESFFWQKQAEQIKRVACIFAGCRAILETGGAGDFTIHADEADAAIRYVRERIRDVLEWRDECSGDGLERLRRKVVVALAKAGKKGLSRSELVNAVKGLRPTPTAPQITAVCLDLKANQQLVEVTVPTAGSPVTVYWTAGKYTAGAEKRWGKGP